MIFDDEIINQIGENVIWAIAGPIKIIERDKPLYKVTNNDFDKIAHCIGNAIGICYETSISLMSYKGIKTLTVFDSDGVGIAWWDFFRTDGM